MYEREDGVGINRFIFTIAHRQQKSELFKECYKRVDIIILDRNQLTEDVLFLKTSCNAR
jgi:hypothetical protein